MSIRHKTTIMIHTLDTPPSWAEGKSIEEILAEVTRWHVKERGWSAVAYAKICDYKGNAINGRDLDRDGDVFEETGAGAAGWNKNTIHLALVGGRGSNANDQFSDHYTPAQDAWLRAEIATINRLAGRDLRVIGHNEVAAKACPGFNVQEWLHQAPLHSFDAPRVTRPRPIIRLGSSGAAVREWQEALRSVGFDEIEVDGAFGPQSAAISRSFPRAHDLTADGVIGPKTWAAMESARAPKPTSGLISSLLAVLGAIAKAMGKGAKS